MLYSILPTNRLPVQDINTILMFSQWYCRDAQGHKVWAEEAKICQDFFEGRQWTAEQLATMRKNKRLALTINRISALIRLVSGYQRNNRTDINYLPSNDGQSAEDVADVLDQVVKCDAERNKLQWTDSEVFMDGIVTGRGFWDFRLDFEKNDLGDTKVAASDPFSILVDCDADNYDITNTSNRISETRWVNLDEIEGTYGVDVMHLLRNRYTGFGGFMSGKLSPDLEDIARPVTGFGQFEANGFGDYGNFRDVIYNELIDTQHKRFRVIDTQYYKRELKRCFIDLQTGDKEAIPDSWDVTRIQKALLYAQSLNQPLTVAMRPVKTAKWGVMIGDTLCHLDDSPYETFTKVGFFPYFRRGFTRGLVSDLLDPQRETNKRRSNISEILSRNSNPGWMYHSTALDARNKEKLRQHGSAPGINVEWQGEKGAPTRIEPGGYPVGQDKMEEKSTNDLMQISGINESAMGQIDKVQSGRAIEARQRQAVIAIQPYLDNFSRSKVMQGDKFLEIIQNHYTEPRLFRMLGEDGQLATVEINKLNAGQPGSMARLNDVTVGKYSVSINEVPLSASFAEAQFEEALSMLEKMGPVGQILLQTRPDLLVAMSSLPRKEEWVAAVMAAVQQTQAQNAAAAGGIDPATGQPVPGMAPPGAGPQGAPMITGGNAPAQLAPPDQGG